MDRPGQSVRTLCMWSTTFPRRFKVFALAAHSSVKLLAEQIEAFQPQVVSLMDGQRLDELRRHCREKGIRLPEMVTGEEGLRAVASARRSRHCCIRCRGCGRVVSDLGGGTGRQDGRSREQGIDGSRGRTAQRNCRAKPGRASFPSTANTAPSISACGPASREEVRRLILTASGGPFRNTHEKSRSSNAGRCA